MAVTGTGTLANPFVLSEPKDFEHIRTRLTSHYRLNNDVDMSSLGVFKTIGALSPTAQRFSGSFNGNGYKIKNVTIQSSTSYSGFFGAISGEVYNLSIIDANVTNTSTGTGILSGYIGGTNAKVHNIYTSGTVSGTTRVGGIVGVTASTLKNCSSSAKLEGINDVCGIAFIDSSSNASIDNTLFYGKLPKIENAYAITVGTYDRPTNSFWDSQTTGITTTIGTSQGTPLTTLELKSGNQLDSWDTSIWTFTLGKYPYLTSLGEPPEIIAPPEIQYREVLLNSNTTILNSSINTSKHKSIRTVSYSQSIESSLSIVKRVLVVTSTFTQPVSQNVYKELTTYSNTILDEIMSSVSTKYRLLGETRIVKSTLQDLSGYSTRLATVFRGIDSHIDLATSYVTVTDNKDTNTPIYANVYFVVNPTVANVLKNETTLTNKQNQSETSVI